MIISDYQLKYNPAYNCVVDEEEKNAERKVNLFLKAKLEYIKLKNGMTYAIRYI